MLALGLFTLGEAPLTQVQWYLMLGSAITVIGAVRMLLTRDLVARLIGMNVTSIGSLMIILALAARPREAASFAGGSSANDPVLTALVITGLVITVAFTGLGAVLIRRIEGIQEPAHRDPAAGSDTGSGAEPDAGEEP
ncbi:NADH-quinone oxidoreductase subunit K [Nesterenkonia lutea]|nr:NADH-quinone oxidoreductase subunit K [Nesterenkonia lutea]